MSTTRTDENDRTRRGLARRLLLAGFALLVVTIAVTGWYVASASTADAVRVEVSGVVCRDAVYEKRPGERREVLAVTPRTRCVFTVRVINDGTLPVHVDRAVGPTLGPSGGAILQDERNDPDLVDTADPLDPDQRDAQLPLDVQLAAAESTRFQIVLIHRPRGCTSGVMTIPGWPRIEMSVLGRDVAAEGAEPLTFAWERGESPGCRRDRP